MVVYRLVGRDVRAAGGVSIDTVQPVGGVTLRLIDLDYFVYLLVSIVIMISTVYVIVVS